MGVGLGLVEKEFDAFEIPLSEAKSHFLESVDILKQAWTGETFSYQGQHYKFTDVTITPRPIRQPRPPIWISAMSELPSSAPDALPTVGSVIPSTALM